LCTLNCRKLCIVNCRLQINDAKQTFVHRRHTIPIKGRSLTELKALVIPWDKPFFNSVLFQGIAETSEKRVADSIISLVSLTTDASFITSDNPITTEWSRDINGMENGGHVRCVPLDSKHLLSIRPNHQQLDPNVIHKIHVLPQDETNYVLSRNQQQLKQCSLFILGDSDGLASFQKQMGEL